MINHFELDGRPKARVNNGCGYVDAKADSRQRTFAFNSRTEPTMIL